MFDAVLQLANRLKILRVSTATGGSATTVVDTSRTESNDTFNGGVVLLITDADGASAAPEGEWADVEDWNLTTHTATISSLTAVVAPGDTYGIAVGFPLDVLRGAINDELVRHKVVRYDKTSLDIVSGQSEYTLPSGIRADNLLNVYEETDTDSNDSKPTPLNFHVETAVAGSQHLLVIDSRDVTNANNIILEYTTFLSPLYTASDVIDDSLPLARILDSAAASARATRMSTSSSSNELEIELMKIHREDAQRYRLENQIRRPARRGNINEAAGD